MGDMHKDMMEGIKDADADRAFARSMIPHHEQSERFDACYAYRARFLR